MDRARFFNSKKRDLMHILKRMLKDREKRRVIVIDSQNTWDVFEGSLKWKDCVKILNCLRNLEKEVKRFPKVGTFQKQQPN